MQANRELSTRVREVIEKTFEMAPRCEQIYSMGAVPGWDSLGHMRLVCELEQNFGVRFPTYQLAELTSVPAIVDALTSIQ